MARKWNLFVFYQQPTCIVLPDSFFYTDIYPSSIVVAWQPGGQANTISPSSHHPCCLPIKLGQEQDPWCFCRRFSSWSWLCVTGPTLRKKEEETVEPAMRLWWICLFLDRLWFKLPLQFRLFTSVRTGAHAADTRACLSLCDSLPWKNLTRDTNNRTNVQRRTNRASRYKLQLPSDTCACQRRVRRTLDTGCR